MAITTMDGLVSALATCQYIDTEETAMTSKGAGFFQSLWTTTGRPGAGIAPTTAAGVVPTNATAGALPYVNPGAGLTGYLARLEVSCSVPQSIIFYDRLVHSATLNGTLTTAQTVGTPALTRYTTGAGVGIWLECYTALGATAATATVTYTNSSNVTGRSGTASIPASMVAGQMVPVNLQSGDSGVLSVQSVTLSVSTGTAGNFGVTLVQRLVTVPLVLANVGVNFDYAGLGLPSIANNACIAIKILCTTTTTGQIITGLNFISG